MYDYIITFGQEIELFWTMNITGATILFVANRYITLLFDIMGLVEPFGKFSDQVSLLKPFIVSRGLTYCQRSVRCAFDYVVG